MFFLNQGQHGKEKPAGREQQNGEKACGLKRERTEKKKRLLRSPPACRLAVRVSVRVCPLLRCSVLSIGVLAAHNKNGYMSIVRHLDQHPSLWTPAGVPFTKMMYVQQDAKGRDFPAIVRSLVSLDGPLFKVFCQVNKPSLVSSLLLAERRP